MPPAARRACGILAVAGLIAALGAAPGTAAGNLTISGATLDGKDHEQLGAARERAQGHGDRQRHRPRRVARYAVRLRDGARRRAWTPSNRAGPTRPSTSTSRLPGRPANYDAGFTARGQDDCTGAAEQRKALTDALNVTAPGRTRTSLRAAAST